jgi:DNA-binding response OmpR family regulator
MPDRIKALLVEDEPAVLFDTLEEFEKAGFEVRTARTVREALAQIGRASFDVAVFDYRIKGECAGPVAKTLNGLGTPYIIYSGYEAETIPTWSMAAICVPKPCSPSELVDGIRQLGLEPFSRESLEGSGALLHPGALTVVEGPGQVSYNSD